MQISEAIEFVAERKNAMLLAIKSDGRPQSSNVVYVVNDAGQILISVTEGRAKTKNLRRDPRRRAGGQVELATAVRLEKVREPAHVSRRAEKRARW